MTTVGIQPGRSSGVIDGTNLLLRIEAILNGIGSIQFGSGIIEFPGGTHQSNVTTVVLSRIKPGAQAFLSPYGGVVMATSSLTELELQVVGIEPLGLPAAGTKVTFAYLVISP